MPSPPPPQTCWPTHKSSLDRARQNQRSTRTGHGLGRRGRATGIGPESAGQGDYHTAEYLERIDLAFACADLVICRAGAGSVSELAALGLPAIYVPLPIGNGEQRFNAEPVVNAGGGLLVADKDLTPQWVHEHVPDLLADHERLAEFGRKAWEYGIRNAAEIMARHVLQLAEPSK